MNLSRLARSIVTMPLAKYGASDTTIDWDCTEHEPGRKHAKRYLPRQPSHRGKRGMSKRQEAGGVQDMRGGTS